MYGAKLEFPEGWGGGGGGGVGVIGQIPSVVWYGYFLEPHTKRQPSHHLKKYSCTHCVPMFLTCLGDFSADLSLQRQNHVLICILAE